MRAVGSLLALWLAALGLASGAMAREPSIQYAEPVAIAMKSGIAQFDAYGRRFSLTLIDNERVLSKLPVERRQQLQAYRMAHSMALPAPGSG